MSVVIRYSESWARYDPVEVARLSKASFKSELERRSAEQQQVTCGYVPSGSVPANDGEPVRSNVPVPLLTGEADPQDPPGNISDAPIDLPRSRTVIVPGQHTVGHLGCRPGIIAAFIETGAAERLDVSSAATELPLLPFLTRP